MATSMFIQFTKVEVLFLATSVAHRKRSAIPRPLPRAHPHVTMSFAVSASATRVVASARAPVKARNTTVAAFAAPVASKASAAKLAARHATAGVALRATGASTVARAGRNMRVLAGRFEAERTYIMIKPDGVQRGYVSTYPYVEYPYTSVPEPASSSFNRSNDRCPIQPSIRVHHDTTLTVSAPSPSPLP